MTSITIPEGSTIQESNRVVYATAAGTGPFSVPFPYFDEDDLIVYDDGVLQTLTTNYTVSGTAVDDGYSSGEITFTSSVSTSEIIIIRSIRIERLADFLSTGPMPMDQLNLTLDKMTTILQQLRTTVDRGLRLADNDITETATLPVVADRLDKYLHFHATTGAPEAVEELAVGTLVVNSWVENNLLNVASAAAAQAAIECVGLQTIVIPASAMIPTTNSGCAALTQLELSAAKPELLVLDFSGTTSETAQFSIPMPKSWDRDTLTVKFFYTVSAAVGTTVSWNMSAVAVGQGDPIAATYGTSVEVVDTVSGVSNDMLVSNTTPAMTVGGTPLDEDMIYLRVARNVGNDTTTQDARLIAVQLYYTTDVANDA